MTTPKQTGELTEAKVLAHLVEQGKTVLQPFGDNQRYDLVIDNGGEFVRVQCKTGRIKDRAVVFDTSSTNYTEGAWEKNGYDGEADVFIVHVPELDNLYSVPVEDAPSRSMSLRLRSERDDHPMINWASEYEVE